MSITSSEIIKTGLNVVRSVQRNIESLLRCDPEGAFEPIRLGEREKTIMEIDRHAEIDCKIMLFKKLGYKVETYGEEYLHDKKPDLSGKKGLVALVDMVDGTDLLKRDLSNWCSALIFFQPTQAKILGAFVGIQSDGIYYSTGDGAYKQPPGRVPPVQLRGPSDVSRLKDASLCFYGQKIKNLLPVINNKNFISTLNEIRKNEITTKEKANLRIYNLAGNPMMVKLADGIIDCIFEIKGQHPHDVAPGAYIAQQAGAVLKSLDDKDIDLLPALLRPADPSLYLRYILASTEQLYQELRGCLKVN